MFLWIHATNRFDLIKRKNGFNMLHLPTMLKDGVKPDSWNEPGSNRNETGQQPE